MSIDISQKRIIASAIKSIDVKNRPSDTRAAVSRKRLTTMVITTSP
jgi:hypothetical protein